MANSLSPKAIRGVVRIPSTAKFVKVVSVGIGSLTRGKYMIEQSHTGDHPPSQV